MKDKFWEYFDDEHHEYVSAIMEAEKDYYKKSAEYINRDLVREGTVLDIGNGGIINYDARRLKKLVCADISVSPRIEEIYRGVSNISFVEADITDMRNLEDGCFDAVIVQKVIHHLAEKSYGKTREKTAKAMKECIRILKPGGSLIICESTVSRWFERMEMIFYPVMMRMCDLLRFDRVFQYSSSSLLRLLKDELAGEAVIIRKKDIGTGDKILFLGRKMPSWILPCSVTYYLIRKSGGQDGD